MMTRFLTLGLFALVGCGGDSPGSITGTVHGASVGLSDAISASVAITTSGGGTVHTAAIVMSTTGNLCADAMSNTEHQNAKYVSIALFDVNGTTLNTPTAPGAYAVYQGTGTPPAKAATFSISAVDATCMDVAAMHAAATTGTVNLTSISGNAFDGNFDVALDSGDHITGNFAPGECPALQTLLNNTAMPTCM